MKYYKSIEEILAENLLLLSVEPDRKLKERNFYSIMGRGDEIVFLSNIYLTDQLRKEIKIYGCEL